MKVLQRFLQSPQLLNGRAAQWDQKGECYRPCKEDILPHVLKLVKQAHIFVIDDHLAIMKTMQSTVDAPMPIAPPFPVCWFESFKVLDDSVPLIFIADMHRPMLDIEIDVPTNEAEFRARVIQKLTDGENAHATYQFSAPCGVLLHEKSPTCCDLFVLEALTVPHRRDKTAKTLEEAVKNHDYEDTFGVSPASVSVTVYRDVDPYNGSGYMPPGLEMAERWLHLINEGAMGVEQTDAKVYLPRTDKRHKTKPHEIRRIVHIVASRKDRDHAAPVTQGGVIDWSHRWEVRGHWRKVHGIGKDRAGDYKIVGHTWVKNFTKGPAELPLIVKTRVMQS